MGYRLDKNRLFDILGEWNRFLIERLVKHFNELVSYDVAEQRLKPNIDHFLALLREKKLYD